MTLPLQGPGRAPAQAERRAGERAAIVPGGAELRSESSARPRNVEAVEDRLVDVGDVARPHLEGTSDVLVAEHGETCDDLGDLGSDVGHVAV